MLNNKSPPYIHFMIKVCHTVIGVSLVSRQLVIPMAAQRCKSICSVTEITVIYELEISFICCSVKFCNKVRDICVGV